MALGVTDGSEVANTTDAGYVLDFPVQTYNTSVQYWVQRNDITLPEGDWHLSGLFRVYATNAAGYLALREAAGTPDWADVVATINTPSPGIGGMAFGPIHYDSTTPTTIHVWTWAANAITTTPPNNGQYIKISARRMRSLAASNAGPPASGQVGELIVRPAITGINTLTGWQLRDTLALTEGDWQVAGRYWIIGAGGTNGSYLSIPMPNPDVAASFSGGSGQAVATLLPPSQGNGGCAWGPQRYVVAPLGSLNVRFWTWTTAAIGGSLNYSSWARRMA